MSDLVQGPNGWEERYPTHCRSGHPLEPRRMIVGWDGTRRYFFCLHDGHPDEASRWTYATGPDSAPAWEGGTPDHGVTRPERRQG